MRGSERAQAVEESPGPFLRKRCQERRVDALHDGLAGLEDVAAIGRQRDGVGARVLARAPAFEQTLAGQGPHHLGDGGAIASGAVHDVLLAQTILIGRGD